MKRYSIILRWILIYCLISFLCAFSSCSKFDTPDISVTKISHTINDYVSYVISDPEKESIAHASNIVTSISEDSFYVTYYSGARTEIEHIHNTDINVKLTDISKKSFCVNKSCTVIDKGERVGSFTQSLIDSPYDPCLLEFRDYIRVWMVVTPQNGKYSFSRSIGFRDVDKDDFSPEDSMTICRIMYSVDGEHFCDDINVNNLNVFADRIRGSSNHYIGEYPVFNGIKQIGGSLYTFMSFISDKTHKSITPCLLRSDDGGYIWQYLSCIPDKYDSCRFWEVGWDYNDNDIYVTSRSCDNPNVPCFSYNLNNEHWTEYKSLFDGDVDDSRPNLLLYGNSLFLAQNVYPRDENMGIRTRVRIARLDYKYNLIRSEDLLAPKGCSYFSIINSDGRFLMLYSEDFRGKASCNKGDIALVDITSLINCL